MRSANPNRARELTTLALAGALIAALIVVGVPRAGLPLEIDDVFSVLTACQPETLTSIEYGPLYHALLCGIIIASPDLLSALYIKQALELAAICLAIFALARAHAVGATIAACLALWTALLLLGLNGTSEFAFLLALCGCLAARRADAAGRVGSLGLLAAAALVRPEYIIALGGELLRRSIRPRQRLGSLAAGWALLLVVGALLARPQPQPVGRLWLAFGQHFAFNAKYVWRDLGVEGSSWLDWRAFLAAAFPTSDTIGAAARENPALFGRHLATNLTRQLPYNLLRLASPAALFAEPAPLADRALRVACAAALFGAALLGLWRARPPAEELGPLVALAAVPAFSLLIIPWARHLLPIYPLLVVLAGRWMQQSLASPRLWRRVALSLLAGILALGLARTALDLTQPAPPTNVALIAALREAPGPVRLLGSIVGWRACALAGHADCTGLDFYDNVAPGETLAAFAARNQINWIIYDPEWASALTVQRDPLMRELVAAPERLGCAATPPTLEGYRLIQCDPAAFLARTP